MVFRHISTDIKERLVYLADEGYAREDILEFLGVSESSFWRWKRNIRRPRLLTAEATQDIYQLMLENPELYLDEIQQWLILAHDIGMSKSALDDNLREIGISYKRLSKAAAERDEDARSEFREFATNNLVAEQLVFVDETISHVPFGRGVRYSVVAALSVDGYLCVRVVEGSVDGSEFFDFIVEDVLPRMNQWPGDNSVLVMDNCAIHKSRSLCTVVEAVGAHTLTLTMSALI
ncbi:hypothetical protein SCHPADRAFT_917931 [Schizopora paradoxa]|uniref:Tc1-like transposase DDE domain-containing protein n=1 Tax=Schizopora paradoxa TaxID=27342 RepID=A0A0H2RGF7_9AGAM|nr:hypothetical protein SCHPADRAFT_917931 [Schizopora paradoxa]